MGDLDNLLRIAFVNLNAQKEAWLLAKFGSLERAKSVAHLFVLEEHPVEWVEKGDGWTLTQPVRLRYKTDEERQAEQT